MPTRRTVLSATLNGTALTNVTSAACTYSWIQNSGIPSATVNLKTSGPSALYPALQQYNQQLVLTMGAGNNIQRFGGLLRNYPFKLFPRNVGLNFSGFLIRAAEYQNRLNPLSQPGGLTLFDLLGSWTATDAAVVRSVLGTAGVAYSAGNIGGTGVTWGSRGQIAGAGQGFGSSAYTWPAGTSGNPLGQLAAAGTSALDYIHKWDAVSAVWTSQTAPVGFYRTYETVGGIRRALIGGRPRSVLSVPAFSEGIDIEARSASERSYPLANAAYVAGYDYGFGIGPVRNQTFNGTAGNGVGGNTGTFLGQQAPFAFPGSVDITKDFSSPMIEWGTIAEGGIGMNCELVGYALLADWNRETVTCHFRTPRDDLITPGMTILVRGPGGQPDRLGIGEPLWVDTVTTGVSEDGEFYQDIDATGGGPPDGYTPPPP